MRNSNSNSNSNKLLVALLAMAVTGACAKIRSNEVDNDTFFGYYGVTYSEQDGRTSYTVRYAVGGPTGTTVELVSPSSVEINGKLMSLYDSAIVGNEYHYSISGAYKSEAAVFLWTQDDGTQVTNSITPVKAVSVTAPVTGASHSRAADLVVTLSGDPLALGESFEAELGSQSNGSNSEKNYLFQSISSGSQITFAATDLATFRTGSATLTVRREKSINPQSGHDKNGGIMSSKYIASPLSLTINP